MPNTCHNNYDGYGNMSPPGTGNDYFDTAKVNIDHSFLFVPPHQDNDNVPTPTNVDNKNTHMGGGHT